jgi:hypothetical protein
MNKLFLLTSSIQLREDKPFDCYRFMHGRRSVFSTEQRLEQTKGTVESIQKLFPTDRIVIADTSNDSFQSEFDVEYVHLKDVYDIDTYTLITTHPHKCICESTLLNTYMTKFENELRKYDFVVKVTGRYQVENIDDSVFAEENQNKIFFKQPYPLDSNDLFFDTLFDAETKRNGILPHDYDQALYGFGINKLDFMKSIYQKTISILTPPRMKFMDIEKTMYLLTRPIIQDVVHVNWTVSGFDGMSGEYYVR